MLDFTRHLLTDVRCHFVLSRQYSGAGTVGLSELVYWKQLSAVVYEGVGGSL